MSTAVLTHFASAPAAASKPVARKAGLLTRVFMAFYQSRRRHAVVEMSSAVHSLVGRGVYTNETRALLDDIRNVSLADDDKLPFTR